MSQAASRASPQGDERLAFAGVFAATLLGFVAIGSVLPVLPRYVRGPLGGGDVEVGIIIGCLSVTALLGRPFAGRLVDTGGRRRIVVSGLAAAAAGGALLFVEGGVVLAILARLLVGFGDGWLFTAGVTWIVDLIPESRRGRFIGLYGLSIWGGITVGSVIGDLLYTLGGFDAVWACAAISPVLGILIALRVPDRRAAPGPLGERSLLPKPVIRPGSALALATLGYGTMAGFVVLHLDDAGVGHGAAVFTAFATAVVATRIVLGSLVDRLGSLAVVRVAVGFEALGLVVVAFAGSWPVAMAGAVFAGMGFSLLFPALALLALDEVDERQRGAAMAAFTGFFDLGLGLGTPIAGAIAALTDYPVAFCVGAGFAVAAGVLSAASARTGTAQREPPPAPA